ncbi:glycosyltransferase family 4 protein [Hoeflea sp. 108]|jgi:glycosyltransferase involved in cell wall biosynthesis|uniref:glycosyltransferase family 4 protein n=1 Tax=Hoeflea sp. 108 TaxID=1116369 RepID=UPI0003721C6F|nr:glycosyltransferase family 4 protein [Hoeflea sp. 108]
MKIAQVAPLYESVPPRLYGGTERIISYLSDGLVDLGHQVTLFASAESETRAELVATRDCALRLDPSFPVSAIAAHLSALHEVRRRAGDFDIIHFHLSHFLHFPFFEDMAWKTVTTPHGRLDYRDLPSAYKHWPRFPLISISDRQRYPLADANWLATVQHGLPSRAPGSVEWAGSGKYLAFLGRLSRDKRPDRAIEIAIRSGYPLKIAAKIGDDDRSYFRDKIEPLIDGSSVEFVGEIDESQKDEFLGNATALLFPIDWPEPFGLAVIEAMSVGTPVVAWDNGAMPEIVDENLTGAIVDSIEAAVEAVHRVAKLDRSTVRATFQRRFTAERMARDYANAYAQLLALHDRSGN